VFPSRRRIRASGHRSERAWRRSAHRPKRLLVEITGDAVESVDPLDGQALGDALVALTHDDERRKEARGARLAHSRRSRGTRRPGDAARTGRGDIRGGGEAPPAPPAGALGEASAVRQQLRESLRPGGTPFDPVVGGEPARPPLHYAAASPPASCGYDVALFDAMLAESEADWAAALDRERRRWLSG
jgi:hypothetical protein